MFRGMRRCVMEGGWQSDGAQGDADGFVIFREDQTNFMDISS